MEERPQDEQTQFKCEIDRLSSDIRALCTATGHTYPEEENKCKGSEVQFEAPALGDARADARAKSEQCQDDNVKSEKSPPQCLQETFKVLTETYVNVLLIAIPFALAGPAL